MKNIFNIYKNDMKNIFKNYAAIIVVLALCILPSLYAWFNILAGWDPYAPEATRQIKIAVVNKDTGNQFNGKEINVGEQVVDQLKNNDAMGWQFINEEDAKRELEEGKIYATLTIPENFSKDITSVITSDVKKGEIIYTVNEKINAIAPKITSKGATAVQENVNQTIIKTVSDILLTTAKDLGVELEGQIPKLNNVYNKLVEIQSKFGDINNTTDLAYDGVTKIKELISDIQQDMPLVEDTLSNAQNLGNSLSDFLTTSKTQLNNIAPTIKEDIGLVNNISLDVLTYVDGIIDAINSGSDKAPELIDNLIAKINGLNNLSDSLIKILETMNKMSFNKPLTGVIEQLKGVQSTLAQAETALSALKDSVQNGTGPDLSVLNNVKTLLNSVASISNDLYSRFDGEIVSSINGIIDEAYNSAESALVVLKEAESKIPTVKDILSTSYTLADKGIEGITYVKENLPKMEEILNDVISKVDEVNKDEDIKELLRLIQNNVTERTEFLGNPVDLVEESIFPMGNYGSAMTPFYTVLCLWVGMTLLVSMLDVNAHGEYNSMEVYFGKLLLFLTIGITQAIIAALGDLYLLKIYCVNPGLFVAGIVFTSIVFVFIVYSLVSVFGNVGKVAAIILLVLQVAGSGGTFPIQLTPKFFQVINPYLPFTYAISFARESIGGVVSSVLNKDIIIMLIYIVAAILISVFFKKPLNKLISGFTEKFKESGIGEH